MRQEPLTAHEEAIRDANKIKDMLAAKYNGQITHDKEGYLVMPPTMYDIKLEDLGKDSIMH